MSGRGLVAVGVLTSTTAVGTGSWLTGAGALTVMVNVWAVEVATPPLATPPLSARMTWTVAVPMLVAADWYVNAPVVASMAGAVLNVRPPVVPVTWRVKARVWAASSVAATGPRNMPVANVLTVWGPASSGTAGGLPASVAKDGASLTAATVMVNVWTADVLTPPLATPPLSERVT